LVMGAGEPGTRMKSVPLGAFHPFEEKSGTELPVCATAPAMNAAVVSMTVATPRRSNDDVTLDTGTLLSRGSTHTLLSPKR